MKTPTEIVEQMLNNDAFSKWLSVSIVEMALGKCVISATVSPEMINGFEIAHGGISYALGDSALAFAANSYGKKCLSIETSISHIRTAKIGDTLMAKTSEIHRGKTTGIYEILITNQHDKLIAFFKGTVYISEDSW